MTIHPTSHSDFIEIKDVCNSPGTICAHRAVVGSHGMSRVAVCVDRSWAPSGRLIVSGFVVVCLLWTGAPAVRKWFVATASAIAKSIPISMLAVLNMVVACVVAF